MPPFDDITAKTKGDNLVSGRDLEVQAPAERLSQSVLQEMKLNVQKTRNDETTWTKLAREVDVVAGGTLSGTYDSGKRAMTDPATLVKFGSSAAIATGLTLMQGKKGVLSLSAQVVGLAMAGAYARDVYGKGEETWGVMKDTWNTPENTDRNREHIKSTLGPFVVDFGIYTAGGVAGIGTGKFAAKKFLAGENRFGVNITESAPRPLAATVESKTVLGTTAEPLRASSMLNREPVAGSLAQTLVESPVAATRTGAPAMRAAEVTALPPTQSVASKLATDVGFAMIEAPGKTTTTTLGSLTKAEVGGNKIGDFSVTRREVEIPVVDLGLRTPSLQKFPAESPIARVYEASKQQIGKIEVLAVDAKGIEARTANATALGEGRLVTNFHVVENATDIYIMDAAGKAHKAHTIAYDRTPDLAIVQLSNRESYGAFVPAKVKEVHTVKADEGAVVAIGHYDGQNALHASPGRIPPEWRQTAVDLRFQGCIKEGNCGGPLMNMSGEVIGVIKAGVGDSGYASPSWHFNRIMKSGEQVAPPAPVSTTPQTVSTFKIDNVQAARDNVAIMFDTALEGKLPPEFFHSKVKRVPMEVAGGGTKELILKTQISPGSREVTVEPIAFGGKNLTPETYWPGTEIPISTSRMTLRFNPTLSKAEMHSVNDPMGVLGLGFAFRSSTSYLARLKASTQPLH